MVRVLEALRAAPSACNNQPWQFVVVSDESLRRQLAQAAREQNWMAEAPVIVVACGFPQQAYQHMGGTGNSVEIDVAIALDHLTLAAVAEGLGTCWIGAFSEAAVKRLLGVPDRARVVALMTLGYPSLPVLIRPLKEEERKAPSAIFSYDRFST
jgi:nitroreductase